MFTFNPLTYSSTYYTDSLFCVLKKNAKNVFLLPRLNAIYSFKLEKCSRDKWKVYQLKVHVSVRNFSCVLFSSFLLLSKKYYWKMIIEMQVMCLWISMNCNFTTSSDIVLKLTSFEVEPKLINFFHRIESTYLLCIMNMSIKISIYFI